MYFWILPVCRGERAQLKVHGDIQNTQHLYLLKNDDCFSAFPVALSIPPITQSFSAGLESSLFVCFFPFSLSEGLVYTSWLQTRQNKG